MISAVGRRYAKALIEVVADSDLQPEKVLEQLRAIQELFRGSSLLHNVLLSPAVSPSRKRAVVGRLVQPLGAANAVRNFVFVVIDHRRVQEFPSIVEAFDQLLDERMGFVRGQVASASALSDEQRGELETQLSRLSGKKAKLDYTVDPELIGGVVARVGAKIFDGSVRGQLEKLRVKLAAGA